MDVTATQTKLIIWHRDFNLDERENLHEVPAEKAVFGIFGLIHEAPVNCRYVGETANLRAAVKELYEQQQDKSVQKFMQGPWIKMLWFQPMPGATAGERKSEAEAWKKMHGPKVDEQGEYPGYYDD